MSLFAAKEWWGVRVAADDEFDDRHLQVDCLDNSGDNQIVVGSFKGYLKIYQPKRGPFNISQLVYEQNFNEPIMQISIGKFQKFNENLLAILFFKKLAIYQFFQSQMGGLQAKLLKEHKLERNAFNMCIGSFGKIQKDVICIQSCDAMLMIYEAEKVQCFCQLSTEFYPLPGPITYNQYTDSFIFQNSCYELESYKYSNLVAMSEQTQKRPQPDWTLNLGENAIKLIDIQRSSTAWDIIAITDTMLFVVTCNGTIRSQKRFEYSPACLLINNLQNQTITDPNSGDILTSLNLVISSFTHHLMVYQDFQLMWAAKTDHVCHGMILSSFDNTKGLITLLNDEGWLQVIYLGTEIPSVQREFVTNINMSYQDIQAKYNQVLQTIQTREGQQQVEQSTIKFSINTQIFPTKIASGYVEDSEQYFQYESGVKETKLRITLSSNQTLSNVQVLLNSDQSIICLPDRFEVSTFRGGSTPLAFDTLIYSSNYFLCKDRTITINAIGFTKQCNCATTQVVVPFAQFCYMIPPQKQAEFKITLQVNNPKTLFEYFDDLIKAQENPDQCISNQNAMSLKLNNGSEVTVLVSKGLDKWRIQSNNFESISPLLNEIVNRVQTKQKIISFTDQIPFQDFFNVIESHYNLRNQYQQMKEDMEKKAIEFRNIQKKQISRFKEKNPIEGLNLVLQYSFKSFLILMDKAEQTKKNLRDESHKLLISMIMMKKLIALRFGISEELEREINGMIVDDEMEIQGWEETVYGNINHYLRVILKKDKQEGMIANQYGALEDIGKLKKIITLLVDRIAKGQNN